MKITEIINDFDSRHNLDNKLASQTTNAENNPPRDTRLRSCARSRAETHELDIARGDHGMGLAPERPGQLLELVDRLGGARGDGACRGCALPSYVDPPLERSRRT